MEGLEILPREIQVVLADIRRHEEVVIGECLQVWDSMEGKLPSYGEFCRLYVKERMKVWGEKARWN